MSTLWNITDTLRLPVTTVHNIITTMFQHSPNPRKAQVPDPTYLGKWSRSRDIHAQIHVTLLLTQSPSLSTKFHVAFIVNFPIQDTNSGHIWAISAQIYLRNAEQISCVSAVTKPSVPPFLEHMGIKSHIWAEAPIPPINTLLQCTCVHQLISDSIVTDGR